MVWHPVIPVPLEVSSLPGVRSVELLCRCPCRPGDTILHHFTGLDLHVTLVLQCVLVKEHPCIASLVAMYSCVGSLAFRYRCDRVSPPCTSVTSMSPCYWICCADVFWWRCPCHPSIGSIVAMWPPMGVTSSIPVGEYHPCNLQPYVQFQRCMSLKELVVYVCRVENGLSFLVVSFITRQLPPGCYSNSYMPPLLQRSLFRWKRDTESLDQCG